MTSTDDTYNGYTNRETWAASLHISNDEGLYDMARERLEGLTGHESGDALQEWFEEIVEELAESEGIRMMAREVGSAWRVNWQEVAEGILED